MEGRDRLPTSHPTRILARDAKLLEREEALADSTGQTSRTCKCQICIGSIRSKRKRAIVRKHLREIGRHPYHRGKTKGVLADESDQEWEQSIRSDFGVRGRGMLREAAQQVDEGFNTVELVRHAFHEYEAMTQAAEEIFEVNNATADRESVEHDESETDMDDDVPAQGENAPSGTSFAREMLEENGQTLLFTGAKLTSLSSTLLLLNLCRTHGCTNLFITELLHMLHHSLLPNPNTLPSSEYLASKTLKKLGLAYDCIHACPNNCMLFRGDGNENLNHCRKCQAPRYKQVGASSVPRKVVRHFPLIPRLQRMFSSPLQASLQTWHHANRSTDGQQRHAADSLQWATADGFDEAFAAEPRNLRLGLATDGFNPFSVKRSTWSTWPVLLFNYNVPPWLTTKKHFIMLSLIIPGPKSVTGQHFDIFLQPVIDELLLLWMDGIETIDASLFNGTRTFQLRAVLLWTMHDLPAYGVVSGCVTKGYKGCPPCGPGTTCRHSSALRKCVFDKQHRMWLPQDHPYRTMIDAFDGTVETRRAPERLSSQQVIHYGRLRETFITNGGEPKREDPARTYGINRVAGLFQLPYWSCYKIRNTLDPMHIERNISANILKYLTGESDTAASRRDMEKVNKFPHLWLRQKEGTEDFLQPRAPFVFSDSEKKSFMALVASTSTPTGYSATLHKHVKTDRLAGMKSHDHHIMLQDILPAAVRHSLARGPREAIFRMADLFKRICAKVVPKHDSPEIAELRTAAAETLCLFEMWWPPSFFDLMSHLPVHLVEELAICGPIGARWCYSVERYMGVLAHYVRDKARPEASMATGYAVDEALGFCTEYFSLFEHSTRRVWDADEELQDSGEVMLGAHTKIGLSASEVQDIHEYVISHSIHTVELQTEWQHLVDEREADRQQYRETHRTRVRNQRWEYPDHLCCFPSFSKWLREHVQELQAASFPVPEDIVRLSRPPSKEVTSFKRMWAYGAHYRCDPQETFTHTTFDCGIANLESETVANSIDVGILHDILMVSFGSLQIALMKVSWMKHVDQGRRTIKRDAYGFWTVLFGAREFSGRICPYIFPANCSQVFFVEDTTDPSWKVVILHDPRSRRIVGTRQEMVFGRSCANLDAEALPTARETLTLPRGDVSHVVSWANVQSIDAQMEACDDDDIFEDDQYEAEVETID